MDCPNCEIDIERARQGLEKSSRMRSSIEWVFQTLEAVIRENLCKRRRWPYGHIIVNLPLTEAVSIQVKAGKKRFFLEQDILFELTAPDGWHWLQSEIPNQYVRLIYDSLPSLLDLLDKVIPEAGIKAYFQNLQQLAI